MEFHPIRLLLGVMLAVSFPHVAMSQTGTVRVTSPPFVTLSNNFSHSIFITNFGPGAATINLVSSFSPSLQFVSATSNENVTVTASANRVEFVIPVLLPTSNQVLTLTLRPTQTGTVTNRFVLTVGNFTTATNVSILVSELPGNADVAVAVTATPPQPIIVNDWVTFGVSLVNRGGGTVSGIFLTNTFTGGPVLIRGYRPSSGGSVAQNPRRVIFNVGSLAAGQTTNYQITIQPTAASNIVLRSNFRFSGNADTNPANNTASATINVQQPGTNQLIAGIASTPQQFNPQNAAMEQRIAVTNVSSTEALSARVMFSNITYQVFNAVGTNNGLPFVVHPAPIQPGEVVEMLIEYFIPSREPRPDPRLIAYSIGDVTPVASISGSGVVITNIAWRRPVGAMTESNLVLEFPSTNRAAYEVQYSSSPEFTNALRALPTIIAQANRVLWVDYGPPKTVSRPRLGTEILTNIATNSISITNEVVTTNGIISTNFVITNIVTVATNYFTNLNMRFYRAIQLP